MVKTYLHLTGQDVDNEMLRLYGIDVPEKKKEWGLKTTPITPSKRSRNQ